MSSAYTEELSRAIARVKRIAPPAPFSLLPYAITEKTTPMIAKTGMISPMSPKICADLTLLLTDLPRIQEATMETVKIESTITKLTSGGTFQS